MPDSEGDETVDATHVGDERALEIAQQLVDAMHPNLPQEERYQLALGMAYSTKVIENSQADNADIAYAVDEAMEEPKDGPA